MTGASGEQFHVQVLSADPRPVDVLLGVNMDGLVLTDKSQPNQPLRIELREINKWSLRNGRLMLYTRPSSPSGDDDVVVLLGSTYTLRAVLDALTSCCMQLAEILEHEEEETIRRDRNSSVYVHPPSSSIVFWHEPDFSGWMHSQGEVIKTWRKRWFVLKDGFMFRFSGPDSVGPEATPRGVLDLSTVSSVNADGAREFGIRVVTTSGTVSFLAENADSQVQWISALEEGVSSVLRKVAGVDGERGAGQQELHRKVGEGIQQDAAATTATAATTAISGPKCFNQYGRSVQAAGVDGGEEGTRLWPRWRWGLWRGVDRGRPIRGTPRSDTDRQHELQRPRVPGRSRHHSRRPSRRPMRTGHPTSSTYWTTPVLPPSILRLNSMTVSGRRTRPTMADRTITTPSAGRPPGANHFRKKLPVRDRSAAFCDSSYSKRTADAANAGEHAHQPAIATEPEMTSDVYDKRRALRQAVADLTHLKLYEAARWASTQLLGTRKPETAPEEARVGPVEFENVDEHDVYAFASCSFDAREYSTVSHALEPYRNRSPSSRFLYYYSRYLKLQKLKANKQTVGGKQSNTLLAGAELAELRADLERQDKDAFLMYVLGMALMDQNNLAEAPPCSGPVCGPLPRAIGRHGRLWWLLVGTLLRFER